MTFKTCKNYIFCNIYNKYFLGIFFIGLFFFLFHNVFAGLGDNVTGYAWSENIGWISMNCSDESSSWAWFDEVTGEIHGYGWSDNVGWISFNCKEGGAGNTDICSTANYKVVVDGVTGNVSGYAWSDTLKWLSFNRSDTGSPPESPYNGSETYIAHYDDSSKEFSGWGRFLNPNGWDGWIKLNDAGWTGMRVSSGGAVDGWIWGGSVVGWITFQNGCTYDYGVNIDSTTGDFSGYSWSSNIGWITFNPDADTTTYPGCGYPSSPCQTASYDKNTLKTSGWIRACVGTVSGDCSTSAPRADGWDGWIKMSGSSPDYGVEFNGIDEFEGWAYGSEVIGWISFNSTNCDPDGNGLSDSGISGCPTGGAVPKYAVYYDGAANNPPVANVNLPENNKTYTSPVTLIAEFSDPDMSDTFYGFEWYEDDNTCSTNMIHRTYPTGYASGIFTSNPVSVNLSDGDHKICLKVADNNTGDSNQWSSNCDCVDITVGTECNDGKDNDGDSLVDSNDPGCWTDSTDSTTYDATDTDESNVNECNDGIDNDGDGLIDCDGDGDLGCHINFDPTKACQTNNPSRKENTCGKPTKNGKIQCDAPDESFGNCPSDCPYEFIEF